MGQEHSDTSGNGGKARTWTMRHPACEGCGFSFTGSPKVMVCEGGDMPKAGRCEYCLSGPLAMTSGGF